MISRRQLMTAFGAAVLAPVIRLADSRNRDMTALVGEFCAPREFTVRYNLENPWEVEGDSVATDGRALLRVPGLRYIPLGKEGRFPDVPSVFSQFWCGPPEYANHQYGGRWKSLPPLRAVGKIEFCWECVQHEHNACDGCGCENCHGEGYIRRRDCWLCHGRLKVAPPAYVEFGDKKINPRFARLLRQIPGAMWHLGMESDGPILVRGDGGIRALVMPIVR